jgi:hypothetical protein
VLFNPYLWFDEAGQFFISLGIDHWAPPFTRPGGWHSVMDRNNRYLFDPIGFTFLLRLWENVSTNAIWLRTLPFLGFLGMLVSGYCLLRKARVERNLALLLIALLPSSPLLYQFAGELRPYSFEAWGALFAAWVWYDLQERKTASRSLLLGSGMALFLLIRYPFVLAAGVTGLLVLCRGLSNGWYRQSGWWRELAAYAVPQIFMGVIVYIACIRHQPISPQAPPYAMASTLKYNPAFLLHPWTLLNHGFLALFGITLVLIKPNRDLFKRLAPWGAWSLGLLTCFTLFSLLGKLPSDPSSRWAIALNVMTMVCLLLVLAVLAEWLSFRLQVVFAFLVFLIAQYRPALQTIRWANEQPTGRIKGPVFVRELREYSKVTTEPIVCGSGSNPEVRYLFEWGSLKPYQKECSYPGNFTLLTQENEKRHLNTMLPGKPEVWIDFPNRFFREGPFKGALLPSQSTFYRLWRVQ